MAVSTIMSTATRQKVAYSKIGQGDSFYFNGDLYIKNKESEVPSDINVSKGWIVEMCPCDEVEVEIADVLITVSIAGV